MKRVPYLGGSSKNCNFVSKIAEGAHIDTYSLTGIGNFVLQNDNIRVVGAVGYGAHASTIIECIGELQHYKQGKLYISIPSYFMQYQPIHAGNIT